jgi:putative endonuclease
MEHRYFVYLLASRRNGTLYVGVTNDIVRRVYEHRLKTTESFSKRYGVTRLVWFEETSDIAVAIAREKRIKKYPRAWKINLIEERNPEWADLFDQIAS